MPEGPDRDLHTTIVAWLERDRGAVSSCEVVEQSRLAGGWVSGAERVEVAAIVQGHEVQCSFVRKHPPTWTREIEAFRLISEVDDPDHVLPELVGTGEDERGRWLLMPFYAGEPPLQGHVPRRVGEALARLHVHFLGDERVRAELGPPDLWEWWASLCNGARTQFTTAIDSSDRPADLESIAAAVERWAGDARIADALGVLPRTLTHRDVHLGNLMCDGDDCRLIDWGNANWGAPLVDLENITTRDSDVFGAYMTAWERLTGEPLDEWILDVGWELATIQVLCTYLPFPLVSGSGDIDTCLRMVQEAEAALSLLGHHLRRRW
jgi:hypothetical protein